MTKRGVYILVLILVCYVVANQSGIGWLFVVTALLVGFFIISACVPGLMVRGFSLSRSYEVCASPDALPRAVSPSVAQPVRLHENESLRATARLSNGGILPRYFVAIADTQPLAPPDQQAWPLFATSIGGGHSVHWVAEYRVYKRGVYRVSAPPVTSGAPAGLFRARSSVSAAPAEFWVLPDYAEIDQLPLRRPQNLTNATDARVGAGTEIYGTRDYRSGDNLRHIHWRSSARTNRLVVKEFEQVLSSPVTILLDRHHLAQAGWGKETTYEYCVRLAASIARFTTRGGHPTFVAGVGSHPFPNGALGWSDILDHLTRANADGTVPLSALIEDAPPTATLFVLVPQPTPDIVAALLARQRRTGGRSQLAAILCDLPTFLEPTFVPSVPPTYRNGLLVQWEADLRTAGIMVAVCQRGNSPADILDGFNSRTRRGAIAGIGKAAQ